jgi:Arylsulfotransferase (ASST)/Secretion system C-terminal sorting domain/Cep192 domain 8
LRRLEYCIFAVAFYFLIFFIIISPNSFAQTASFSSYQYISPVPNSTMILPQTNIIIREGKFINRSSLSPNKFIITGTKSGMHSFNLILSDDNTTIILKPTNEFLPGEMVYVNYVGGVFNVSKKELKPLEFSFNVSGKEPVEGYKQLLEKIIRMEFKKGGLKESSQNIYRKKSDDVELQTNFIPVTVNTFNNPSPGYLFLAPFFNPFIPPGCLMIVDNKGTPIYYSKRNSILADFKVQPNGLLTYFDLDNAKFYALDSSYSVVDSFSTVNGYTTDIHDLKLLPNGHALLMAYDPQPVRMDTVVSGGDSSAIVVGLIIQELDESKNVVFQWRSWDHFKITDVAEDINLHWQWIDYVHGNAIEPDIDGNIIISARHMDEITKINRQTGDIIWRWGGLKSRNNQFVFINDDITFSHQHDIRRLPNGNLTFFDNGNLHSPPFSRSSEYQLDEINKVAILVWSYNNNPETYSFAMGNSQRIANHNTIIGWGWNNSDSRALSEIKVDGTVALELSLPDTNANYRTYRFPWKTNLFVTNPDSFFFESVPVGDSSVVTVDLINNSSEAINITGFFNYDSSYSVITQTPFILPSNGTVFIDIKFKPYKEGYFKDYLHIRSDTDTSRIAQVMLLKGRTDTTYSDVRTNQFPNDYSLEQNYPNPFNPSTTIEFHIPTRSYVKLIVYDILGNEVNTLINEELSSGKHSVKFNAVNLSSGVYFYRLNAGEFNQVKKLIIIK